MVLSVTPPVKYVGRMPAIRVSQEKGLTLSSREKAVRPPEARLAIAEILLPLLSLKISPKS